MDYKQIAEEKHLILDKYFVISRKYFNPLREISMRVNYLVKFLERNGGVKGFVLGISGGVDSALAGKIAQIACKRYRSMYGKEKKFIAVRLPYGEQRDENDAQAALDWIRPDEIRTVNIKESVDSLEKSLGVTGTKTSSEDFHKGNIKARVRMAAQYYLAGVEGGVVLGTDHNSEAVMGFFTKHGDGACDLLILNGLNKTLIKMSAEFLNAPKSIVNKVPTADLEELNPGKPDSEGFGFDYDLLDQFLEGEEIPSETLEKIIRKFKETEHKRNPAVEFDYEAYGDSSRRENLIELGRIEEHLVKTFCNKREE